jgi:DNA-binding CsgD family transcriptional regulator
MFQDTSRHYFATESFIRDLAEPKPPRARKGRRTVNYKSRSTAKTLAKQAVIRELLATTPGGLSVAEIGAALGISRQLALYHVKKMAATYQLTMQLEPCLGNGGLQFRCWDDMQLAVRYARLVREQAAA